MGRRFFMLAICAALLLVATTAQAIPITYHVTGTLDYQDSGSDPLALDDATYDFQMTFDTTDNDLSGFYLLGSSTLTLGGTPYSGTAALGIADSGLLTLDDTFFLAAATPMYASHDIQIIPALQHFPALPFYDTGDVVSILSDIYYVTDFGGDPNAEFFFDLVNAQSFSVPSTDPGGQEPIPEPATLTCFGIGLVGLGLFRARKKARRKSS